MTDVEKVMYRLLGKKILGCLHAEQECYIEEYGSCSKCPVPDHWLKNYGSTEHIQRFNPKMKEAK